MSAADPPPPHGVETAVDKRVLVAGVGNIFLGDDAFGCEVARRLVVRPLPDGVRVADFGIRAIHLAYELSEPHDLAILVDAAPRGNAPGTICVIEPDFADVPDADDQAVADAHTMHPDVVLTWLKRLGGTPGRLLVVGCEPASVDEGIGLSDPVARAVDEAVDVIEHLIAEVDRDQRPTTNDQRPTTND